MEIKFSPEQGLNPVHWTQNPSPLPRHYITSVLYTYMPGEILPLKIEIYPWISRSPQIAWTDTQGDLCTHVGYLGQKY